jgi:hypothetical protein
MIGFQIRTQSVAGLSQAVGAIALSLCCATAALAQEIPDYGTEAFCERRAGSSAPENRRFASCLQIEEIGLAELEDHWTEANEPTRLECIDEANQMRSYAILASCVMHRVRQQRRR